MINSELLSAILGSISGAITSAICYYFLDKRKEKKLFIRNKQTRADAILFLKSLKQYCGKDNKYLDVLNKLGNYRIFNMSQILEKVGIVSFKHNTNGDYIPLYTKDFYSLTKKELKVIIKDIRNCKFE